MDQELERYNKCNAQLELTISDLKLKNEGLKTEVTNQRCLIGQKAAGIKGFHHDLHSAAQSLQVRFPVKRATLFAKSQQLEIQRLHLLKSFEWPSFLAAPKNMAPSISFLTFTAQNWAGAHNCEDPLYNKIPTSEFQVHILAQPVVVQRTHCMAMILLQLMPCAGAKRAEREDQGNVLEAHY
jgi:hypothetical protein